MNPTDTRPVMTERIASLHEAEAGIRGRQEAQAAGADPHQLRTVLRAARAGETPRNLTVIGGLPMHDMCLAVSTANEALKAHPFACSTSQSITVARTAFLFHDPIGAYELLRTREADDLAELDSQALELVGGWGKEEMTAFANHMRAVAPAPAPEEVKLGKREAAKRKKPLRVGRGR